MITPVLLATEEVVIRNVALLRPAGTVTLDGALAAGELSLNATAAPPLGAGPLSVTVPCDVEPPTTLAGLTTSAINAADVGSVENATEISPRSGMALK